MFIIKYHAKGKKTKYFGGDKIVVNKKCALAFGENLRENFAHIENKYCKLENISVSDVAEEIYADKYIKLGKISW